MSDDGTKRRKTDAIWQGGRDARKQASAARGDLVHKAVQPREAPRPSIDLSPHAQNWDGVPMDVEGNGDERVVFYRKVLNNRHF